MKSPVPILVLFPELVILPLAIEWSWQIESLGARVSLGVAVLPTTGTSFSGDPSSQDPSLWKPGRDWKNSSCGKVKKWWNIVCFCSQEHQPHGLSCSFLKILKGSKLSQMLFLHVGHFFSPIFSPTCLLLSFWGLAQIALPQMGFPSPHNPS